MTRLDSPWRGRFQTVLRLVYPPLCLGCGGQVEDEFGLCGPCWRDMRFIGGLVCDLCGTPLPGDDDGHPAQCDECLATVRPWARGRAALLYRDMGRRLILRLKHGDRHDLAVPAGRWMARAVRPILQEGAIVAPIPLHWSRLLRRRYNQAALLSAALSAEIGAEHVPDLLRRVRRTRSLDGLDRRTRFDMLRDGLKVAPRWHAHLAGRPVLLVDDVMTSGATFSAAAQACIAAGAAEICVVSLARVAKEA